MLTQPSKRRLVPFYETPYLPVRWRDRRYGFTLVEIMVVVIILGILAATIVPQFGKATQDAKVARARADIAQVETQIELYFLHMDGYLPAEQGLQALVEPPAGNGDKWRGPYLKEVRPDPWGNPYRYRAPGLHGSKTYDLWSTGADGVDGGDGMNADITNWTE